MPTSLESNPEPSPFQQYLNDVSKPLPAAEQEAWRTEVSQHLEAMIAAYEELGYSRVNAVTLALERFGAAKTLGTHLRTETNKSDRWSLWRENCVNFIVPVFLCFTGIGIACLVYSATGSEALLHGIMVAGSLCSFAAPLLGGTWMGYRAAPHNSFQHLLVAILCTMPYCLMPLLMFVNVQDPGWVLSMPKALIPLALWVPLAVIGAAMTRTVVHPDRRQLGFGSLSTR